MDTKGAEASSVKLNIQEIRNKDFKKAMWGFSPREVVAFLESLAKSFEKMQKQERDLNEKIKSVGEELTRWKNKELEMQKLREKAQHEADALRADAAKEAERIFLEVEERASEIRRKTEDWLENVIAEVEETERQKINFMTAFRSALDSHYALLRSEQQEGEPLGANLNSFLKQTMHETQRLQ